MEKSSVTKERKKPRKRWKIEGGLPISMNKWQWDKIEEIKLAETSDVKKAVKVPRIHSITMECLKQMYAESSRHQYTRDIPKYVGWTPKAKRDRTIRKSSEIIELPPKGHLSVRRLERTTSYFKSSRANVLSKMLSDHHNNTRWRKSAAESRACWI